MGNYRDIYITKIFSSESVAASGSATSAPLDLGSISSSGYFSLQVAVTGSGELTLEFELSNDGINYVTPTGSLEITTGLSATSGPGSDGKDIYSFGPILARWLRIKATETGTSDAAVLTAFLAVN
jgi:hypothetical protein